STNLRVSLEEAKQYAISHNHTMQNATYAEKKAEAQKWQIISTMLPQVTLGYDYNNFLGNEIELMGQKIEMNPTGTFTATASMTLSGAQIAGAHVTKLASELSKINTEKNNQDISSDVKQTYMSILMLEKTNGLLKENLENIKTLQTATDEAVRVGVSEETDADQLKVQVASMKNTINQTERSIETLYNTLKTLLGASFDTKIVLTDSIGNLLNAEKALNLLSQGINLNNNNNYRMLKANTEIAKNQVRQAWWNYGPQVTAFYQYSNKQYFADDVSPFSKMSDIPHIVGVSASWTPFTSGGNYAKVKAAKMDLATAQSTLELTADQLKIQDAQARFNLNSTYENYKTQEENLEVTAKVLASTTNKFRYGTASSLDVTNASTNLIIAQNNYVSAMSDLINAQITLEKLLNTPNSSTQTTANK
ncbi:MAG: TolC family protein, partial [Paludibacteraceae bacterium]|nr:TolC family protein [Paludibacteraceae bacterium]